jgi:hypothetical protein
MVSPLNANVTQCQHYELHRFELSGKDLVDGVDQLDQDLVLAAGKPTKPIFPLSLASAHTSGGSSTVVIN